MPARHKARRATRPSSRTLERCALTVPSKGTLSARIKALIGDTVSPRVTMQRVLLLLTSQLPSVAGGSVRLGLPGHPAILAAGSPDPEAPGSVIELPIGDEAGNYGMLRLFTSRGQDLPLEHREIAARAARALAPLARIDLKLDVPATPQPPTETDESGTARH